MILRNIGGHKSHNTIIIMKKIIYILLFLLASVTLKSQVKSLPLISDSLGIYTEGDDYEQSRVIVFTSICITGTMVFIVNTNAQLTFEDMKLTENKDGYMKLSRFANEEDWASLHIDFNKLEAFLMLSSGEYFKFYLRKNW